MKLKTTRLKLKESYPLTTSVRHFVFHCNDDLLKSFIPGQFITMHLPHGDKILRRSYSIANKAPSNYIEFAAGFVPKGPASEALFSLKPGDEIQVSGAFGRLILKEEPVSRYFLIATSTGITPYRAMLANLSKTLEINSSLIVHILEGVRSRDDLLYASEFQEFSKQHKNAHFHACLSREKSTDLQSHEFIGYVQDKLAQLKPNADGDIAYLCGNPAMVDACYQTLTNKELPITHIRREKYISR
tara:strand:+ start:517 stop:1248 length:732 start_codon:yes stop_codon:yes gene_type:complete